MDRRPISNPSLSVQRGCRTRSSPPLGLADVIVLGTHGRTGLERLNLGSVARNVLHHATCSVLIARAPVGRS